MLQKLLPNICLRHLINGNTTMNYINGCCFLVCYHTHERNRKSWEINDTMPCYSKSQEVQFPLLVTSVRPRCREQWHQDKEVTTRSAETDMAMLKLNSVWFRNEIWVLHLRPVKMSWLYVWAIYSFVWNSKGTLWNSTQNMSPLNLKICISFIADI